MSSFLDHSQHMLTKGHIFPTSSLLSYRQEWVARSFWKVKHLFLSLGKYTRWGRENDLIVNHVIELKIDSHYWNNCAAYKSIEYLFSFVPHAVKDKIINLLLWQNKWMGVEGLVTSQTKRCLDSDSCLVSLNVGIQLFHGQLRPLSDYVDMIYILW